MVRYAAPLYVDMTKSVKVRHANDEMEEEEKEEYKKIFIGEV